MLSATLRKMLRTESSVKGPSTDMENEFDYVIAIDIGTSYAGYAFNSTRKHARDQLNITVSKWWGKLETTKAPTSVLFNKEGHFHSFGFDAEQSYARELAKGEHKDWMLFKGFKMELYKNKKLNREFELSDLEGRKMQAREVFTAAIKHLKDTALRKIQKSCSVTETKIRYVLTVPAIWKEPAKGFMREAAERAGIPGDQLILALEPEAAALYCRHMEIQSGMDITDQTVKSCFQPGGKYMIIDLGGGTVDTVVHSIDEDGQMSEHFKSSGGPWGGDTINENFHDYIRETYGKDALEEFKSTRPEDFYDLERDFEHCKRSLTENVQEMVRMKMPQHLKLLANRPIPQHTFDHLYIQRKDFTDFFDLTLSNIEQHIKKVASSVNGIAVVFLVGGFSESSYVEDKLKKVFSDIKLIVPIEPGLAILKGAVLFGFNPQAIKQRVCRFTYGIRVNIPFNRNFHSKEKFRVIDGEERCIDIFKVLVKIGEKIPIDEVREADVTSPHHEEENKHITVKVKVFASSKKNPFFTTDDGCIYLGEINIHPPENGWPKERNYYKVRCQFGRTELSIYVHDATNDRKYDTKFDMLE